MICNDCQDLLSDYIDGHMDLGEQAKIEHHVYECDGCRGVRDDLLQIVQFSRNLPLHSPSNTVWDRIKADIDASPRRGSPNGLGKWLPGIGVNNMWSQWMATMAAVLILIVAGMLVLQRRGATSGTPVDSSRPPVASIQPGLASMGASNIPEMEQEISQLKASVERASSTWDPEVRTVFNRDMVHVDQTLERCRHRLSDDPDDDTCKEMMLGAYREKVRLLESFTDF